MPVQFRNREHAFVVSNAVNFFRLRLARPRARRRAIADVSVLNAPAEPSGAHKYDAPERPVAAVHMPARLSTRGVSL